MEKSTYITERQSTKRRKMSNNYQKCHESELSSLELSDSDSESELQSVSDDENKINNKKKRKRGENRDYDLIKVYESLKQAKQELDPNNDKIKTVKFEDQVWKKRCEKKTNEGDKIYFTCKSYSNCPKTLYLLIHNTNLKVSLFMSECDHQHETKKAKKGALPIESVNHVMYLLRINVKKNNEIIKALKLANFPILSRIQLNNLKSRLKYERNGKPTLFAATGTNVNNTNTNDSDTNIINTNMCKYN